MGLVHFSSLQNIKDNSLIDTNVGDKKMNVMLRTAEDTYLQELLGTPLFNVLKTNITSNELTTKQRELIQNYILNYLYVLIEFLAIEYLLTNYASTGVNVSTPDNTAQRTMNELSLTKTYKIRSVNYYAGLMKTFLENNITDFEEYNETDEGLPAKKINNYGIFFDDDDFIEDIEYNDRNANNRNEESI